MLLGDKAPIHDPFDRAHPLYRQSGIQQIGPTGETRRIVQRV